MKLAETMYAKPPPLQQDAAGTIRVGGTRVTLKTVINAYRAGASAEEIALAYDALRLADVHEAIGYYLRHQAAVDQHLAEEESAAARAEARCSRPCWNR